MHLKDEIKHLFGYNPIPSIPSAKAFGIAFLIMFKAPLTSAFIIMPFALLNKPLLILFPTYLSWCSIDSMSKKEHLDVCDSSWSTTSMLSSWALYCIISINLANGSCTNFWLFRFPMLTFCFQLSFLPITIVLTLFVLQYFTNS